MTLSLVGRALKSSSYCPGFNLGGFNPRLTLKQADKSWSYAKENIFLSSVGRALNSSSDGPGSNLGGFNPLGEALNSSSDCPGFNLGGFNPRLTLEQAAKSWSYAEENIFLS
jgi:hypothetical protein